MGFVAVDKVGFVAVDVGGAVPVDVQGVIALDVLGAVVEGQQVKILLGVNPDLLLIRFILEAQLVETSGLVALGADNPPG